MSERTQLPTIVRATHRRWLSELTQIPTAAGREQRVMRWIERWAAERPEIVAEPDAAGNIAIRRRESPLTIAPVWFTAHLDHPAFVVERIIAPGVLELSFRGGVMDDYFKNGRIAVFDHEDRRFPGVLTGSVDGPGPFKRYTAELASSEADSLKIGDVAVWDLPAAEEIDGCIHTSACDDLAAAAAALASYDALLGLGPPAQDVRLLFTRAEEIGFVGAIAACRLGTLPGGSRIIALENSRSFPDSPIGGGPIVRVGDRLSIFTPRLTDAVAKRAEDIAGAPPQPIASQKRSEPPAWKWQRKLMAGGACESSVFCDAGYECTCVCLPLGNYHNMGDLAAVQAGTNASPAVIEREFISLTDFDGLVDLLVACGRNLPAAGSLSSRFEKLYDERAFVLKD
ncbi:hypothetical protein PHYC_00823 [Phycisphaerales bacterium]|nr:hypothetical protein PHYC_00823 [Phycisphaerales bacterium]